MLGCIGFGFRLTYTGSVSTLLIVVLVGLAVIGILFVGGLLAAGRRDRALDPRFLQDVAAADRALEAARAGDRGWDRAALDAAARAALGAERPGHSFTELHLTLVDDRPGIDEDRAQVTAVSEAGETVRIALVREQAGWRHEHVT